MQELGSLIPEAWRSEFVGWLTFRAESPFIKAMNAEFAEMVGFPQPEFLEPYIADLVNRRYIL